MDIIDIMLAKAMTPQGQTETYVSIANAAAAKAEKAKSDAADAVATVEAAATSIAEKQEAADTLLATAQETLETAQAAQINTLDLEDVDDEIKQLSLNINVNETGTVNTINLVTTYPDDAQDTDVVTKLYKTTGSNQDGTMTQKAITDALGAKADITYVNQKISQIPSGGGSGSGSISFQTDDAGHILVIGEDGNVIASNITEETLINSLLNSNYYVAKNAVGLDLDYSNKIFTRTQQASYLSMGSDFDQFIMYGGRVKCNVADDGTINAFYGDNNYTEDGSNGQVMIYQPKFYYLRTPYHTENLARGKVIRHESLMLSSEAQSGFKLAPIFEGDLEYVLLPAYDASINANKLASVAGALPISNLTIQEAEAYANARGNGWHIVNIAAESTNQMLEIVEFGMMNGQTALGQGIVNNPGNSQNCYFITGSTASFGNGSGQATATQVNINGNVTTQTEAGKLAITYRGMENPWGNLWQMIGGINIYGNGALGAGAPYICTDFNYTPTAIGDNYEDVGFNLPYAYKWVSALGYGNSKYDWVFLPAECASTATSLLPIGDGIWSVNYLNGMNILASGGSYGFGDECGPFYYAADRNMNESSRSNYGVKLMYIPTKNSTYEANIAKWTAHIGG